MELWIAFAFGLLVGIAAGFWVGRHRGASQRPPPIAVAPPGSSPPRENGSVEVRRVALDDGSANVLNALNNRLSAIGALADLIQGPALDAERARALTTLQAEMRRAAELTQHFLELAEHPVGAAQPSDAIVVLSAALADRDVTLRELGVKLSRTMGRDVPLVACAPSQLGEILTRLLDFSLRRLRDSQPPRELRVAVKEAGPSVTIAVSDSGTPLSVEAEQRLVSPFRFTQGGGGEIEFALARALAQSSGGTLRLRPTADGTAEVVITLPKSVLAPHAHPAAARPSLPKLRILVVDDDSVNRQAMRLLLEREGHQVVAVENGIEAIQRLGPASESYDAIVTDLQMPRLGGRALWEQLADQQPGLANRVVFVTGDLARDETRRFLEECGQPSVLKPYDLGNLLRAIGMVASRGPGPQGAFRGAAG